MEAQWNPFKNILLGASYINTKALNYRWVKALWPGDKNYAFQPGYNSDKSNTQLTISLKFMFNGSH
jgi:hypothetical protein